MIEQGQVGLRVAAIAQLPVDGHHHRPVGLRHRVVAHIACALLGIDRFDLVVDADAGNWRLDRNQHLARIVTGNKAQGLEIDHQGIGLDQKRLVFIIAVVVKHRQMRLFEEAAIQNQVAAHLLHAIGPQVAHQQPEFFHVELGIAATLEVQVALQDAIVQGAVGVELGFPLMGRAEHFKGGVGGDQLHGGGRVHRHVGVEDGGYAGAAQGQHHQRQCVVLQLVGFERLLNLG